MDQFLNNNGKSIISFALFLDYRSGPVRSHSACTTKKQFWSVPAWTPILRQLDSIALKTHRARVQKLKWRVNPNSKVKAETRLVRNLACGTFRTRSRPIAFKHLRPTTLRRPCRHTHDCGKVLNPFVHVCVC